MRSSLFAIFCALMFYHVLSGIAAAEDTQLASPPLQLLQPQQSPGQTVQQPAAPTALHDIHGPIDLPEPVPYLLYSLIGLTALVLLFMVYWWFFKRRKPLPPPIPPGMRARDELMRAREFMNSEQALRYMERISEILRSYLEARFTLHTTRQTTREFFQSLAGEIPDHLGLAGFNTELKTCLERCDLAKFAHQPAAPEHMQEMENSVLRFVNQTEPSIEHPEQQSRTGGGD